MTNRLKMALTIYYTAFYPAYFTRSFQWPGNGRILANGKSISRILFRTEKEDYLWRLSTIFEKIFRKIAFHLTSKRNFRIFWRNGKHPKRLGLPRSQDLFGGAIVRHFESPRRKDPGNEVLWRWKFGYQRFEIRAGDVLFPLSFRFRTTKVLYGDSLSFVQVKWQ